MIAKYRPYILGLLGIALITGPFLWLRLLPDFDNNTVKVIWSPHHGVVFFTDLLPVFVISLLIWLGIRANRRWAFDQRLAKSPAWQKTSEIWTDYWFFGMLPLALSLPAFLSASGIGLLTNAGIYMLLALGLNITVGMTGLLVLGYAGFYAFGAYFFSLSQQHLTWITWWMVAPFAFLLGGSIGYILGLPCLRLRGDYLAIVTLGFAEAFRETIRNLDFTGGDQGIILPDKAIFRYLGGTASHPFITKGEFGYLVTALVLFVAVFLVQRLYHSPLGRAWIAIRENEVAAEAMGVPVVQMKLLAFSLSAAIAALAGVISGAKDGFVSPAYCEFQISIMVLAMVILGGLGNSYGALLGAALLYLVPEYLKFLPSLIQGSPTLNAMVPKFLQDSLQHLADYRLLLFGAVMVIMMLYRPQGLLGSRRRKTEMRQP